jgi:hypothetical protein
MEQKVSRIGIWHNLAQLIMPSRVGLAFGIWHFPLGNAMPCQGHVSSLKNQPRLANHYAEIFSTRRMTPTFAMRFLIARRRLGTPTTELLGS